MPVTWEERCRRDRKRQVLGQVRRAEKAGLPATLTFEEWERTLTDFNGLCAYCQSYDAWCIEHFIPIRRGGGTTADNCVPACQMCNAWRRRLYDGVQAYDDKEKYDRVAVYLATRQRRKGESEASE